MSSRRIGITSQNRRTVTGHAGRCRRFWVYDVKDGQVLERRLLELDKSRTLHELRPDIPEELRGVDVLVSAEMCDGLSSRLQRHGIRGVITTETDPDTALQEFVG
jgi:predicted Fe-Mo cluster-binding NifX family protein